MKNKRSKNNILCIVQARMSSSRLPGKVLKEVIDRPLLSYMIERIKPSKNLSKIVIATSWDLSDDPITNWCIENNIAGFRGSLNDVLDRFYQCAISQDPVLDTIIRLTADCPLHHYEVIDFAIDYFHVNDLDYFTNSFEPDYEDGFDVEVFKTDVLKEAWKNARKPSEREHVTLWIRNNPAFKKGFKKYRDEYKFKLSVDSLDDFILVEKIIEHFYKKDPLFTIDDVILLLKEHPEYLEINKSSKIDEGLELSLRNEIENLK